MAKRKPKVKSATQAMMESTSSAAVTDPLPVAVSVEEVSPPPPPRPRPHEPTTPSPTTEATIPGRFASKESPAVNPFPFRTDVEAGVRLMEDRRFKQMQIAFEQSPSEEVRYEIRNAGYRWQSKERVWSKQLDPDKAWQTRADADELFAVVTNMIRQEKGLGQQR
jgi:hypothetical protein